MSSLKEYDFRFLGIDPVPNSPRTEQLNNLILKIAGGFTQILPDRLLDLIPGEGVGYIVAIDDERKVEELKNELASLAKEWGVSPPDIKESSKGPHGKFCFFLLPKYANPVYTDQEGHAYANEDGYRRPLFTPEKWALLSSLLENRFSHPPENVYGEWLPSGIRPKVKDPSRMYIFPLNSPADETFLREFIQSNVYDSGVECDQEIIYLSIGGFGHYADAPAEQL